MPGELSKAQPRRIFSNRSILTDQALQKSIPRKRRDPHTIPGSPPDLSKPISGCPFAPRCEFAQQECVTSTIDLKEITNGHFSACLRIQLKEIDLASAHLPGSLPEMNGRAPEPV